MRLKLLDTETMSSKYRNAAIDLARHRILLTDFRGTEQEKDLTEPANCSGLGRIRHFRRSSGRNWVLNPLPIDPACRALELETAVGIRAQVFQNAVCNWRCWYCFVDFQLLAASRKHSRWVSPAEIVDLYLAQTDPPSMIDLTGGQPDLTPEWVPWMMRELRNRGLANTVYLWSDDNLSNDYFWRYLSDEDRELIACYPKYGRVCCFKGFNTESFTFNTLAQPELFAQQFDLMRRLLSTGIDLYAYVTFTTPSGEHIARDMARFVDRLQAVSEQLPLRTVPLQIQMFTPVKGRMDVVKQQALEHQQRALDAWERELETRFSATERSRNIVEVPLGQSGRRAWTTS
jgi:uncharacterized Fe-S cluster-containing radical SAM superfamily protein